MVNPEYAGRDSARLYNYQRQVNQFALDLFDRKIGELDHPSAEEACEAIGYRSYLKLSLAKVTRDILDLGIHINNTDRVNETLKIIHEKTLLDEIRSGDYTDVKKYCEMDRDELYSLDSAISQGFEPMLAALPRRDNGVGTLHYVPPVEPPWMDGGIVRAFLEGRKKSA